MSKTKAVESQENKRVHVLDAYGFVQNSDGTWDRLRAAQPGMLFAYDDSREVWVECDLVLVKDGRAAGRVETASPSAPSKPVDPHMTYGLPKPLEFPKPTSPPFGTGADKDTRKDTTMDAPPKPIEPYPPFEQPKPSPYPTPHPTGPPDKPHPPLPSPPKPEDRPRF
jgi:hypothetical protein